MKSDFVSVAAYTGGRRVPSARYRVRQYIRALKTHGVRLREFVPLLGTYPIGHRVFRPLWAVCSVMDRSRTILQSRSYDVTLLQREMLSTLVTLEPMTKAPRILDVDDAIWLRRGGRSSEKLAQLSQAVICGNSFLAERFSTWNANVSILPTAVDTEVYLPCEQRTNRLIIGWSGTSGGFRYLDEVQDALAQVLRMYSGARLLIVSDKRPDLSRIPSHKIEFVPWTPTAEVKSIQKMTVGLMPLNDTDWERGKCSLKMLTYMACEIPVVVSKIGTNNEILNRGTFGFGATTSTEWVCSISDLLSNPKHARVLGRNGRDVVNRFYSVSALTPRLAETIKSVT